MNHFTRFMVSLSLLAFAACTTDMTSDEPVGGLDVVEEGVSLTVSLPSPDVRTELGEKVGSLYPVHWCEGDRVSINGRSSNDARINEENPSMAIFNFNDALEVPYRIIYPATEGLEPLEESLLQPVVFAVTQNYVEGTFESGSAPMYGYTDDPKQSELSLSPLAAAIRFAIKAEEGAAVTLRYITLSTLDESPLAGTYDVDCESGALTPREGATHSTLIYKFDADKGFALGAEADAFYMAIPAGEYAAGFRANFVAMSGEAMSVTFEGAGEAAFKAGIVREFPELTFRNNHNEVEGGEFIVGTSADMVLLAEAIAADGLEKYNGARLVADIDMSDVEWSPISFTKKFEGGNFTISGLTHPLFDRMSGTVQNLTVEGDVTVTGSQYSGILANSVREGSVVENCTVNGSVTLNFTKAITSPMYFAAVAGLATGARLTNVTNNASITVETLGSSAQNVHLGAIAGFVTLGTSEAEKGFISCVNNGDVTWECDFVKSTTYISGLVGRIDYSATDHPGHVGHIEIRDCVNNGKVTNNGNANNLYMAGILALGDEARVSNCKNNGAIQISDLTISGGVFYCGGVMGLFNKSEYTDSGLFACENTGSITFDATNEGATSYFYMGGIIGATYRPVTDCTNRGKLDIDGEVKTNSGTHPTCTSGVVGRSYNDITNCINYGDIDHNLTVGGAGYTHTGGVIAYFTDSGGWTASLCKNYGNIVVSATTAKQCVTGGVIGSAHNSGALSVIDCINGERGTTKGSVTFSGNASAYAATAGVVGVSSLKDRPLVNLTNYAPIRWTGKSSANCLAAGVVGQMSTVTSDKPSTGLNNYGEVSMTGSASVVYVGGITGNNAQTKDDVNGNNSNLENSHNRAKVYFAGTAAKQLYMGGVMGNTSGAASGKYVSISGCTNTGEVVAAGTVKAAAYVGGIGGQLNFTWTDCTNSGKVSVSSSCVGGYIGGLAGYNAYGRPYNSTNSGAVLFSGTCATSSLFVGGAFGDTTQYPEQCHNSGDVSYTGHATGGAYIAGCFGRIPCAYTGTNSGKVFVSGSSTNTKYGMLVGGVAAIVKYYIGTTGVTNNGDIEVVLQENNDGVVSSVCIGGVMALSYLTASSGKVNFTSKNLTNNGNITLRGTLSSTIVEDYYYSRRLNVGGIMGRALPADTTVANTHTLNNALNTGKISIQANGEVNNLNVGGITGEVILASYVETESENRGDIELTGVDGGANIHVGGHVGQINDQSHSSSEIVITGTAGKITNSGNISLSERSTNSLVKIGGLVGSAMGLITNPTAVTLENCSNSGSISRTSETLSAGYGYAGGMLGGANLDHVTTDAGLGFVQVLLTDCSNSGSIQADPRANGVTLVTDKEQVAVGGMIGMVRNDNTARPSLANCSNTGEIDKTVGYAGEIIGWNNGVTE